MDWLRDSASLPPAARAGHDDCLAAIKAFLHHRPLVRTALETEAIESLQSLYSNAYTAARFEPSGKLDPAYRFRPLRLPFSAQPATADAYFRTEQQIKEQILRLVEVGLMESRFGLAAVAEAELFTDGLIRYGREASSNVPPMDRERLLEKLPELFIRLDVLGNRILLLGRIQEQLPPRLALQFGVSGTIEAILRLTDDLS